jgi:hypothetical protein
MFCTFPHDPVTPINYWGGHTLVPLETFPDKTRLVGCIVMYTGAYVPLSNVTGKIFEFLEHDRVLVILETVRNGNRLLVTQKIMADVKDLKIIQKIIRDDQNPNIVHVVPRTEF